MEVSKLLGKCWEKSWEKMRGDRLDKLLTKGKKGWENATCFVLFFMSRLEKFIILTRLERPMTGGANISRHFQTLPCHNIVGDVPLYSVRLLIKKKVNGLWLVIFILDISGPDEVKDEQLCVYDYVHRYIHTLHTYDLHI